MKILLFLTTLSILSSPTFGLIQSNPSRTFLNPIQHEHLNSTSPEPESSTSTSGDSFQNIPIEESQSNSTSGTEIPQKYMIIPVQPASQHYHATKPNPLISIALGLIILLFAIPIVWLSERRTAELSQIINEGQKACADGSSAEYNPELNEELVYLSGVVSNNSDLDDPTFGVSIQNAVKIKRIVEVYQVKEIKVNKKDAVKRKTVIGETNGYIYEKVWCPYSLPSSIFHNEKFQTVNNNVKFIVHSETILADTIEFGQHKLAPFQIERLNNWEPEPVEVIRTQIENREDSLRRQLENIGWKDCYIKVEGDYIIIKQQEGEGIDIGDMRISYQKVPCGQVTVISEQAGILFRPYNVKLRMFLRENESELARLLDDDDMGLCPRLEGKVDLCCKNACCLSVVLDKHMGAPKIIDWIYPDKISKTELFGKEIRQKRLLGSFMRLLGLFLVILGTWLIMSPLINTLVVVRTFEQYNVNGRLAVGILMGLIVELITVGFAWMFYRRGLSLVLLITSALIISAICLLENWNFLLMSQVSPIRY